MSYVTNYVLMAGLRNGDRDYHLPGILVRNQAFKQVDDFAGGSKEMETMVAIAAMNYARPPEVCAALVDLPWREPGSVQLAYQDQEEDVFTLLDWNGIREMAGRQP